MYVRSVPHSLTLKPMNLFLKFIQFLEPKCRYCSNIAVTEQLPDKIYSCQSKKCISKSMEDKRYNPFGGVTRPLVTTGWNHNPPIPRYYKNII